jgi:DNA-binding transcriptional LysR family regulator
MDKYNTLFNRGGLSLDRLRNFVLISDAGGISRATNGDSARMSLFSKQIKELETFFGTALTRRQGRTIKFTDAGNQLAKLARSYLCGLEDFQSTCIGAPQTISLGSGNSLIEWLVMPKMARLRQSLPGTVFELYGGRTEDLVRQLTDMRLDLALIREDALVRPLKFRQLLKVSFSLFLPKPLAGAIEEKYLKSVLANLPLATSVSGLFREQLTATAAKAGWPLRIELSCSSFTAAARAVKTGQFGAALPNIAAVDFAPGEVVQYPLPFLKSYARTIGIAWNPRLAEVRPVVEKAITALNQALN